MELTPSNIIAHYLPIVYRAGQYALRIQKRVASQDVKDGENNKFSQALTDADPSVQTFFEVETLALFPEIGFWGEEVDKSYNMKYFNDQAEYRLLLDPIDGTLMYMDNLPNFNIILTVIRNDEVVGAIIYRPGKDQFYYAIKCEGARYCTGSNYGDLSSHEEYRLSLDSQQVAIFNRPDVREALSGEFDLVDMIDYEPPDWDISINSILWGDLQGSVGYGVSLIDWGAIGFVAVEAGGVMVGADGNRLDRLIDLPDHKMQRIIMAHTEETAFRLA